MVPIEVGMIKRQYKRAYGYDPRCYFNNFIDAHNGEDIVEEALKPYKATMGKSKRKDYLINIKWHDPKLYLMFILRWA